MRDRIFVAFIVLVGLVMAIWFYNDRMTAVTEQERLWMKISGDQYSTLAECLDYAQGVQDLMESCREIEETVNQTAGE